MTKTQFKVKTLELIENMVIIKECERLFDSGAVDTKSYVDNYILPKIILCVALENISEDLHFDVVKKETDNLRKF